MSRVELLDGGLVVSPFLAVAHQHLVRNLAALEAAAPEGFVVSARVAGGRLVGDRPSPADLDLAALATATRYPGP
jgi:hypothetical protein